MNKIMNKIINKLHFYNNNNKNVIYLYRIS